MSLGILAAALLLTPVLVSAQDDDGTASASHDADSDGEEFPFVEKSQE